MVTMVLAGAAGEQLICGGPITDGSDQPDIAMAREYLYLAKYDALMVEAEIMRCRAAAERLVRSEKYRIQLIAAALLKRGTLLGNEVEGVLRMGTAGAARPLPSR